MMERRRYGGGCKKRVFRAMFALGGAGPGRGAEDTVSSESYEEKTLKS